PPGGRRPPGRCRPRPGAWGRGDEGAGRRNRAISPVASRRDRGGDVSAGRARRRPHGPDLARAVAVLTDLLAELPLAGGEEVADASRLPEVVEVVARRRPG